jgi:hypothetical protein
LRNVGITGRSARRGSSLDNHQSLVIPIMR